MASTKDYFARLADGKVYGPVNERILRQLAASGRLTEKDALAISKDGPWHKACNVRGLFPPPLPTKANATTYSTPGKADAVARPGVVVREPLARLSDPAGKSNTDTATKPKSRASRPRVSLAITATGLACLLFAASVVYHKKFTRGKMETAASVVADAPPVTTEMVSAESHVSRDQEVGGSATIKAFEDRARATLARISKSGEMSAIVSNDDEAKPRDFTGLEDGISRAIAGYRSFALLIRLDALSGVFGTERANVGVFVELREADVLASIEKKNVDDLVGRAALEFTLAGLLAAQPSLVEADFDDLVRTMDPRIKASFLSEYQQLRLKLATRCRKNCQWILNKTIAAELRVN